MTERTSHLAGLWIGAAISNTSHSNKAGSPLSNEHGSQVKDQDRRQCCHNKHKNFPIGLYVMYLYFLDTPHTNDINMFKNTGCFSKGESAGKEPVTEAKMDEVRSAFVLSPIISTGQAIG
jgi:hypothetical protein